MHDLIDRIYECAFAPDRWPAVCDALGTIADTRGAFLFTANTDVVRWTASEAIRSGVARFVEGRFYRTSERGTRAIAARHPGFMTEADLFRDDELANDPLYRDYLYPAGLGHAAGTVVNCPTGDVLFISMERERAKGPVDKAAIARLDALRPHLARAALMSARLQLERARSAGAALAALGLPALVCGASGAVLAANGLIESLPRTLRWQTRDRVSFIDASADAQWLAALETVARQAVVGPLSFAVRGNDLQAAQVAHVVPVSLEAHDLFVSAAAVLVLSPVALPRSPPVELVQSLFDLTPAEARVARELVAGNTVDEISRRSGVAVTTVRTQVRGVLEKTGSRRQTEVVALLGGLARP